jgi:hypothetical protein
MRNAAAKNSKRVVFIADCGLRIADFLDCGLRIADCGLNLSVMPTIQ